MSTINRSVNIYKDQILSDLRNGKLEGDLTVTGDINSSSFAEGIGKRVSQITNDGDTTNIRPPLTIGNELTSTYAMYIAGEEDADFIIGGGYDLTVAERLRVEKGIICNDPITVYSDDGTTEQIKLYGGDGSNTLEFSNGNLYLRHSTSNRYTFTTSGTTFKMLNVGMQEGTGSPEGVKTGKVGDIYLRTDGGAGTTFYVKESGTGTTGWVAK